MVVAALVVALHAFAILLIDRRPREPAAPPEARPVLLALAAGPPVAGAPPPPAAATPSTPPPDPDVPAVPNPPDPESPSAAPASSPTVAAAAAGDLLQTDDGAGAATGATDDCDIPAVLQARLGHDAAVRDVLAKIPSKDRSVANAVMLWDGRWVLAAAKAGAEGADPIREIVVHSLRSAPPSCVRAVVRGPRFILLPGANSSVVLTFGSGEWSWADLLASP